MVVEKDRGVGHGGEPNSGDPDLPEIPTIMIIFMTKQMMILTVPRVRPCRKYLGLDLEAVLDEGPGHRLVPRVPGVHGGQALVSELHQDLEVNVGPGLRQPASPRTPYCRSGSS